MRVLVTGGAGFIGSHVVDAHVARGDDVAVVDNLATGADAAADPAAGFFDVDLTDRDALRGVFERFRPQVVNHHAASVGVRGSMTDPIGNARTNVLGTINLLDLAMAHGVKHVVFASTCAVYSEPKYVPMDEAHPKSPQSAYGVSKLSGEHYVRMFAEAHEAGYRILRYGNVYGPRQSPQGEAGVVAIFTGQMLRGEQPSIFGDGSKTRDYVFVEDVARANLLAADRPGGGVHNISGGAEVTDFQIFESVRRAVGSSLGPRYVPKRLGDMDRICLDISSAQKDLGWTPATPLHAGIAATVCALKRTNQ